MVEKPTQVSAYLLQDELSVLKDNHINPTEAIRNIAIPFLKKQDKQKNTVLVNNNIIIMLIGLVFGMMATLLFTMNLFMIITGILALIVAGFCLFYGGYNLFLELFGK